MTSNRRITFIVWLAVVALHIQYFGALPATGQVTRSVQDDPVRIDSGLVSGTKGDPGVKMYLGIPFAAPPVRDNRWRAPQPVAPWRGVLTANRKPAECVQRLRNANTNQYFGEELSGEDCLYLNIWEPENAKKNARLPVVVYIYGGGFYVGSASMPLYSGEVIAKKGVIYVAANYRVGVFGFLSHPAATAESGHHASGNWGLLDQIAALQWVKQNIQAFGGDPDNVTLVGQSAGAMSINCLQASPLARGLFQRIIAMSGAAIGAGIRPQDSLAKAEEQGIKLQQAMKVSSLQELRQISPDKVFAMSQTANISVGPVVDGYVLPQTVDSIFEKGAQNDVPLITGSTANDIGTDTPLRKARTVQQYHELAKQAFGADAETMLQLYPARTDAEAVAVVNRIAEDSGFAAGARSWATAQSKTGKRPAYMYILTHVQPFSAGVTFSDLDPSTAGAYHTSDVPYWLGTYEAFNALRRTRDWTDWDRKLSDDMQDVIVSFAKTGNPSTQAVRFVPYDPHNEMRIDFGDSIQIEQINTKAADLIRSHSTVSARPAAATNPAGEPARPKPTNQQ